MNELTIIVPCYNEETNIKIFYQELINNLDNIKWQVIFVNDGSKDKTKEEILKIIKKNKNITLIDFSRNFGKEAAMYAGLNQVNKMTKYVAIIDADMQQNPKYLYKMYEWLEENIEVDMVACFQKKRKEGLLGFIKKEFYKLINSTSSIKFENGASDFRMFRQNVLKAILSIQEHHRFSKGIFSYVGFNTYYMPYEVEKRHSGKTKWNFKSLIKYALLGFRSYTDIFYQIIKLISLGLFTSSFIYLIYGLLNKFTKIDGIITLLLFLSGLIVLVISILADYINMIDSNTKNRPQYIVRKIYDKENN